MKALEVDPTNVITYMNTLRKNLSTYKKIKELRKQAQESLEAKIKKIKLTTEMKDGTVPSFEVPRETENIELNIKYSNFNIKLDLYENGSSHTPSKIIISGEENKKIVQIISEINSEYKSKNGKKAIIKTRTSKSAENNWGSEYEIHQKLGLESSERKVKTNRIQNFLIKLVLRNNRIKYREFEDNELLQDIQSKLGVVSLALKRYFARYPTNPSPPDISIKPLYDEYIGDRQEILKQTKATTLRQEEELNKINRNDFTHREIESLAMFIPQFLELQNKIYETSSKKVKQYWRFKELFNLPTISGEKNNYFNEAVEEIKTLADKKRYKEVYETLRDVAFDLGLSFEQTPECAQVFQNIGIKYKELLYKLQP